MTLKSVLKKTPTRAPWSMLLKNVRAAFMLCAASPSLFLILCVCRRLQKYFTFHAHDERTDHCRCHNWWEFCFVFRCRVGLLVGCVRINFVWSRIHLNVSISFHFRSSNSNALKPFIDGSWINYNFHWSFLSAVHWLWCRMCVEALRTVKINKSDGNKSFAYTHTCIRAGKYTVILA